MAGDRAGMITQDLPDTVTGRGLASGSAGSRFLGLATPAKKAAPKPVAIAPAKPAAPVLTPAQKFGLAPAPAASRPPAVAGTGPFGGTGDGSRNNFSPQPLRPAPAPTPQPHPAPAPTPKPTPAPQPSGGGLEAGTPPPSSNPPPGQSAKVGSGAYIPPPMQTTKVAGQGDVYSWNFPTASATPQPAPSPTPPPAAGGGGGPGPQMPTQGQQNAIGGIGSLNPQQKANLAKGLNLPTVTADNPWVQQGFLQAGSQPITPSILRQNGYQPYGYGPRDSRAAGGGIMTAPGGPSNTFMERGVVKDSEGAFHHSGLVHSSVAGRTDRLPVSVPAGAYVIPADVVSGLGEGNTLAGAKVLDRMMHSGPFGTTPMAGRSGGHSIPGYPAGPEKAMGGEVDGSPNLSGQLTMPPMAMPNGIPGQIPGGLAPPMAGAPQPPQHQGMSGMKRGGNADDTGETVPIIIAGGEYVVHPDSVKMVGKGDLTRGHDHLDAFVKNVRSATASKMQKLPGPKK